MKRGITLMSTDLSPLYRGLDEVVSREMNNHHGPDGGVASDPDSRTPSGFGARFSVVRKKLGLSQKAFASAFGISVGTIRHWEQKNAETDAPDSASSLLLRLLELDPEHARRLIAEEATHPRAPEASKEDFLVES